MIIWQVWADISTGILIPVSAIILHLCGIIPRRHLWLLAWGFAVGATWEYQIHPWNPVWITINDQGYTVLPQAVWAVAPIVYYLGVIRINRALIRP